MKCKRFKVLTSAQANDACICVFLPCNQSVKRTVLSFWVMSVQIVTFYEKTAWNVVYAIQGPYKRARNSDACICAFLPCTHSSWLSCVDTISQSRLATTPTSVFSQCFYVYLIEAPSMIKTPKLLNIGRKIPLPITLLHKVRARIDQPPSIR